MALSFRQTDILEIARTEGKVVVEDLATRFDVTVQTIRRDLSELSEVGALERVHGGAVMASGATNIGYEHRRALHRDDKAAIARRCVAELPPSCSIFLNIGTTTEAVAGALRQHNDLLVVTNNMNVANMLVANESCETIVTGGKLRRTDGGLVGDITCEVIAGFKFDFAVIGCSALDEDGDLLDFDVQEVSVSRAILRQARRTFLVADNSKFCRSAPARIASLRDVDTFFTDRAPPPAVARACAEWKTRIVLAEATIPA